MSLSILKKAYPSVIIIYFMSDFYRRWPAQPDTDYRPGLEKFTTVVEIPDATTKGSFSTTHIAGREDFFSSKGTFHKRLERIEKLAQIGAARVLLHASGLWISSDVFHMDGANLDVIDLETSSLTAIRQRTNQLAKPGVVTPGSRVRVALNTKTSLFSKRTLVEGIHGKKVIISSVPSDDAEVNQANKVLTTHDLLDHTPAALLRSDEVVALEAAEAGKRLKGLAPGQESSELQQYASVYDDVSVTEGVHAILTGDRTKYADWQYLWGAPDAAMDGIVERWNEQLNGIVIPEPLRRPI